MIGVIAGLLLLTLLLMVVPGLPIRVEVDYLVAAFIVAVTTGLISGLLPARRAASIDPVEALHAE